MADKKLNINIGELAASAPSDAQAADEMNDKISNHKKSLIKLLAMGILLIILVVFRTISWFTQNLNVSTEGMNVRSQSTPFEIYTETDQALAVDRTILSGFGYSSGAVSGSGEITGSTSNIQWLLTDESHFNNRASRQQVDGNGDPVVDENDEPVMIDADTGIGPGSYGTLTFWIVPNYDLASPTFKIDLKLNGLIEEKTASGTVTGYKKLTDTSYSSTHPNYAVADALLKGHLLFFEQRDTSTGKYSTRINNMTFTKTFTNQTLTAGQKYPITFHWIWPRTFGQMILEDTDRERLLGTAMFAAESSYQSGTSPRVELATYINNNKSAFFYRANDIDSISVVDMLSDSDKMKRYFSDFSNGYNNADQLIGNTADYALLEADVSMQN